MVTTPDGREAPTRSPSVWISDSVLRTGTRLEIQGASKHAPRGVGHTRIDEKVGVPIAVRLLRSSVRLHARGNEQDLVGILEVVTRLFDHWPELDVIGSVELASRQLVPELVKAGGISTAIQRKVQKIFSTLLDRTALDQPLSHKSEKLWSIALSKVCDAARHSRPEDRHCAVQLILDTLRAVNRLPKPFIDNVLKAWLTDDALPALLAACDGVDTKSTVIIPNLVPQISHPSDTALHTAVAETLAIVREKIGSSTFEDLSALYSIPKVVLRKESMSGPPSRARYLLGTGSSLTDRMAVAALPQYSGAKCHPSVFRNIGHAIMGVPSQDQPYMVLAPNHRPPPGALGIASRASTRPGSGIGVFAQESPVAGRPRLPSRRGLSAGDHGLGGLHCGGIPPFSRSRTRPRRRERPAAGLTGGEKSLLETIKDSDGGASSERSTARDIKGVA